MHETDLRQRCESRLRDLPFPVPFQLEEFCKRLADQRGRPLSLHSMPRDVDGTSGLWLSTPSGDHVFVAGDVMPLHREHIVLHELGHIVSGHEPTPVLDGESAAMLLPNLSGDVVARVLARTSYTSEDEREAELMATLIARRASREATRHADQDVVDLRDRLRSALG